MAGPQAPNKASGSSSGEHLLKLDEALASDRSQVQIEKARRLVGESNPPGEMEEVQVATENLTSAVDQMVPSLLLSLGMLDTAVKWLKMIVAIMVAAFGVAVFIAVRMEVAASAARDAATEVSESKKELAKANLELVGIRDSLTKLKVETAKQAIDQASQPKIVAGDKPGEVSIVTPVINQAEIKRAKADAEKAVKAGREPPPVPMAEKATKIPAQLKPAEVEKLDEVLKK